jgi:hypothetical protein
MAAAIPYALMIGGTVLQQRAAKQQADEQRSELNKALTRTDQTQKKANTAIGEEAAKLAPATRMARSTRRSPPTTAAPPPTCRPRAPPTAPATRSSTRPATTAPSRRTSSPPRPTAR